MQITPSNLNHTNGYQLMETPDDIIINNQVYDKFTMEPKEFKFFNTNFHLNHKVMLKHQVNILEYPWSMIPKEPDYEYYIIDNQDVNIFYCISEKAYDNQEQYILKVQKTPEGEYKILNYISPDNGDAPTSYYHDSSSPNSSRCIYKLLGQNDSFLYIAVSKVHSINHNFPESVNGITFFSSDGRFVTRIKNNEAFKNAYKYSMQEYLQYIVINKKDMTISQYINVEDTNSFAVFKIKEDNNKLYLMENICYDPKKVARTQQFRIVMFNNTVRTVLNTLEQRMEKTKIGLMNFVEINNEYRTLVFVPGMYGWKNTGIFRFTINNNDTVTFLNDTESIHFEYPYNDSYYTITDFPWVAFGYLTEPQTTDNHMLQLDIKQINDTYFSITRHDISNKKHQYQSFACGTEIGWGACMVAYARYAYDDNVFSSQGYHRHYLCKEDSENGGFKLVKTLTPVSETQHIYGVLYYNELCPIFLMKEGIFGYKLDLETEDYEIILNKPGTYYTIGLDENNSLYLCDINDNIEIYNDNTVYELKATFEQDTYEYDNQNISTYVTIYAKNFTKDYIKTKVKLTLDGHCHFNATNNNQLITYTNKNGIVNVPITITYGGSVHCDIQEVE